MPQSPPPYCRFKKLSYNHSSQESASPRQEVELPMPTKREPPKVFRMRAAVPVPVKSNVSGIFICEVLRLRTSNPGFQAIGSWASVL